MPLIIILLCFHWPGLLVYDSSPLQHSQHLRCDHRPAPELVAAKWDGGTATGTSGLHGRWTGKDYGHHVPGSHRLVAVVGRQRQPRGPVRADGVWRVRVRLRRRTSVRVPKPSVLRVHCPRASGLRVRIAGRGRARVHYDEQHKRHRTLPKRVPTEPQRYN